MKNVDEIKYVIYKITNTIDKKIYIGKTTEKKKWKPNYRFSQHITLAKSGSLACPKLYNSIRKHGENNFIFEVIDVFDDENNAYIAEEKYILIFNSLKEGLNTTPGGKGIGSGENNPLFGTKHTEEFKRQVSEKIKIRNSTLEYKAKYLALLGGENCYNAKLINSDVVIIKTLLKECNLSHAKIGKLFNVTKQTITGINTGKTWKNIVI
jgi:group I intron endonuclease